MWMISIGRKEKDEDSKQSILCKLVAVLLAVVCLVFCLHPSIKTKQYDVVLLGDSVIGNVALHEGVVIHEYIEEQTGKRVLNGAFGGSGMALKETESFALCSNSWCMANLALAIATEDWNGVRASMSYADYYQKTNRQVLAGYKERLETLAEVDFSKVEVLFIEHGTNDYNSGVLLDNAEDPYDVSTFGGALRSALKLLLEKFPDLKIVLVTPAYCEVGEEIKYSSDEKDWGGGLLKQYVEMELEIASQYGVDVIDAYHESGINKDNVYEYTVDGLHPNEEGVKILGDLISGYLKGRIDEHE